MLSLPDLVSRLERGTLPANAAAVTFDDGYADNLSEASPRLLEAGVPATLFVATGFLDRTCQVLVGRAGHADPGRNRADHL